MTRTILTFLSLYILQFCYSQNLVPFQENSLWGYKDQQGQVKITPQFQYASNFSSGYAIVANQGKFGAIDSNNKLIFPFRYDFLRPLDDSDFLFGFKAKYFGEYFKGVMTKEEKIKIPADYSSIFKERNHYTIIKIRDSVLSSTSTGDFRSSKSVYGVSDIFGNVIIPCEYHYINWLNDSLIDVSTGWQEITHALFTQKGEQLTRFEFMSFGSFLDGIAKARIGNKFGFIYPNGKIAIPIIFDYCEEFNKNYAIIKQQEKWGAIDKNGKLVIDSKFTP